MRRNCASNDADFAVNGNNECKIARQTRDKEAAYLAPTHCVRRQLNSDDENRAI